MIRHHCDICGVETKILPKTETVFEVIDEKPVMKTSIQRVWDSNAQEFVEYEMPVVKELESKCIGVQIVIDGAFLKKDFCRSCFESNIKPNLNKLWEDLAKLKDVE